jgi:hypothetical protein
MKVNKFSMATAALERLENVYIALVGQPEGNMRLSRPGSRWKDNIKICVTETDVWMGMWVVFSWYRTVFSAGLLLIRY